MRILYFSQFYKPENIAASFRATEHSRIWVRESHDVTVFTGWPNYPVGRLFDGYEMKPLVEELIDGVRVFRSASKIQPNTSFAKRIERRNIKLYLPIGKLHNLYIACKFEKSYRKRIS